MSTRITFTHFTTFVAYCNELVMFKPIPILEAQSVIQAAHSSNLSSHLVAIGHSALFLYNSGRVTLSTK